MTPARDARAAGPQIARAPEAVVFDLDGVLLDSEELQYRAYAAVLAGLGATVSREEYAAHWIAAGDGPEYAVRTYRLSLAPEELRRRKGPVYQGLLRRHAALMPGAAAALARLSRDWRLGLATNSQRDEVDWALETFHLRPYFAAVVTREDYAAAKPAPDAYLEAAWRLGVAPPHCLVVEDAARGVRAAVQAGTVVVAIPNGFTAQSDLSAATLVLRCLDELTVETVVRLLAARRPA